MATTTRLVTQPTEWNIAWSSQSDNTTYYTAEATVTKPVSDVDAGILVVSPGNKNFVEVMYAGSAADSGFKTRIFRWQKVKTVAGADTATYVPQTALNADVQLGDVAAGVAADSTYSYPAATDYFGKQILRHGGDPAVKISSPADNGEVASILLDAQGADVVSIHVDLDADISGFTDATGVNILWRII